MTATRPHGDGGRFQKGRAKTGGRRMGTPNVATREVKAFLSELITQCDVQEALRGRLLAGDSTAFFKACEAVLGKPRQTLDVNPGEFRMVEWPDNEDVQE